MRLLPPAVALLVMTAGLVPLTARSGSDTEESKRPIVGADFHFGLLQLASDCDLPLLRTTAAPALRSLWDHAVKADLIAALGHAEPEIRGQAAERLALGATPGDREAHEALGRALADENPRALGAVYLALGRINADGAADVLVNSLSFDEGKDKHLRESLIRAIAATGKTGIDKLLALADSGSDKDLDQVLDAYPSLGTRAAGEGLIHLVKNYHVTPPQKVTLIRSYSAYRPLEPPLSMKPLAEYLASLPTPNKDAEPKEVKKYVDLIPVRLAAVETLASARQLDHALLRETLRGMIQMGMTDRLSELVEKKGDAQLGREVFRKNKVVACASCHRLNDIGKNVGPDLSRLWSTHTTSAILEILLVRGMKVKESYHDLAQHLSFNEILDLAAFLRDRKAQEALRGFIADFAVAGPFDGDSKAVHGPEKNADPGARYDPRSGKVVSGDKGLSWQTHKAGSDGLVDLAPLFAGSRLSAYAVAYIHAPMERKVHLEFEGSAVARYWLNGTKLLDFAPCCGAEPVPVALVKGWNSVLVRVFATQGELAFAVRISGAEGLRFSPRKD